MFYWFWFWLVPGFYQKIYESIYPPPSSFLYIIQRCCRNFLNTHSPPFRFKTWLFYQLPEALGTLSKWLFFLTKFLFGPSFICQILMIFSFLESIWHKKTDCTSFAREIGKLAENNMSKDIFTILVFLNYTSGYI